MFKIAKKQKTPRVILKHWLTRPGLFVFLGSIGLTALYGREVLFNLASGVLGGGVDGFENMWNDFWVQKSFFELGANPFYTDYIYYPAGTSLRFHTLHPSTGLLSAPLWWLFGGVVSTNLVFLLSLTFTCFFAFLLIRDLLFDDLEVTTQLAKVSSKLELNIAAFAGAALFTFANNQVLEFFKAGQTEKLSAQWLPLYLFFLWRSINRGTKWWIYTGLSILTLVVLSLTDWQYLIYAILTTLFYFVFLLFSQRSIHQKGIILARLALIGTIYSLFVILPLIWPMFQEASSSPWLAVSQQSIFHSRDLADYILPTLNNPGYLALVLIFIGAITAWRNSETVRFWATWGGIAVILTLGPQLIFFGVLTDIPLLYALLYRLPLLSSGRDPQRFYTLVMLAYGILLAYGLLFTFARVNLSKVFSSLTTRGWFPVKKKSVLLGALTVTILAISLAGDMIESGKAVVAAPDWPPFYQQIAKDPDQYAILEVPTFPADSENQDREMGFGTLHRKYRFGGRMARDHKLANPANFTKQVLLLRDLFYLDTAQAELFRPVRDFIASPDFQKVGLPLLNYYNVRYIVLYNQQIGRHLNNQILELLTQVYGGKLPAPYYTDKIMRVFKVPTVPALPPREAVILDVGNGWYKAESDGSTTWRWADVSSLQGSELIALNLSSHSQKATLSFKALNFVPDGAKQPRTLLLKANSAVLGQYHFPEYGQEKEIAADVTVPPGVTILSFTTPEEALPANPNPKIDGRKLTLRLSEVKFTIR